MPQWKRLTRIDSVSVEVNLDQVAYMYSDRTATGAVQTVLVFARARADSNCVLIVKETTGQIHATIPSALACPA
jgi:hypothetical protein